MENDLNSILDKMVDYLMSFDEIPFLDLVQYVWRTGENIGEIEDPKEENKLRYALKACLVERMVEIWSMPPRNKIVNTPEWCKHVGAVDEKFSVIKPEFAKFWENEAGSFVFEKRNIFAPANFMFFL